MEQVIRTGIFEFVDILKITNPKRFMLVTDSSFRFLPDSVKAVYEKNKALCVRFDDFTPNPLYEDVVKGVELFRSKGCDVIVAIGGGSTIDVAKCIKLYCKMNAGENFLKQEYDDSGVPLIAIPTTAGTGSESTRYAVIYYEGKKQSVTHESIIPNYVILDSGVLKTLPLYQKKCTMLDALCQGIESWWSINSTEKSKEYSEKAVRMIVENYLEYLNGSDKAAEKIMLAANYAGRAINITQTTAAHAMSYKLTSMYKLPHGHAVAVCLPHVWRYMNGHSELCIDSRGKEYLMRTFKEISLALGCSDTAEAVSRFVELLHELGIFNPEGADGDIKVLTESVNPIRLKNNPVCMSEKVLFEMYNKIVRMKNET